VAEEGTEHAGGDIAERNSLLLRCHILPKWRRIPVNEIKPKDMRDWLYSLHDDEELSGETVKKIKNIFSHSECSRSFAVQPRSGLASQGNEVGLRASHRAAV
jgi:hypothetical protein